MRARSRRHPGLGRRDTGPATAARHGVRALFFLVDVNGRVLGDIARRLESGALTPQVGEILPLTEARTAHEMIEGRPHWRGKIVLTARTR